MNFVTLLPVPGAAALFSEFVFGSNWTGLQTKNLNLTISKSAVSHISESLTISLVPWLLKVSKSSIHFLALPVLCNLLSLFILTYSEASFVGFDKGAPLVLISVSCQPDIA